MTTERDLLEDTTEDLLEDAPCGHISTRVDGTILRVNRTFEEWTGLDRADLVDARRFQDLLSPGGQIYYETHYVPLLHMQDSVRAIAVEIVRADGSRMPALINSVLRRDAEGRPRVVWTSVFDATDRRGYEEELLRAREREHVIGQQLQRSMLSGPLPTADGLELDVVYRPAERGLEVGGDWYDAFWLDDGRTVALVVGDVVGHGVEAAATMGQLRSAVRGLVSTGLTPAALLERLDEYSWRHEVGKMCTLIYAELSLPNRTLRFACAGHPPPLLAIPGEEPRFAWGGRSTPLDTYVDDGRSDAIEELPPETMVLLYTDGLVEHRSIALDDRMEHLRRLVAEDRSGSGSALLSRLVRELRGREHGDDVCAIAALCR